MKKAYLSLIRLIAFIEDAVSILGLTFATFSTVFQIVNRYWLHYGIMWIGDLTLYIFVFSSFFSVALATREDSHICVDVFIGLFCKGESAKKVGKILTNLICITFLCALTPVFYAYFLRALKFPEWGTLVRWFNSSWIIEVLFVTFILNIYHIIHNTVRDVVDLRGISNGGVHE